MLELYSVVKGEVVSVQPYGVFVKLPDTDKNGLVHISQMSVSRVEKASEVCDVGEKVYCKVVSMQEDGSKISLSMKVVNQTDGRDLDPNNVQLDMENQKRRSGIGREREPIELGAIFDTTCKKCGGKGHLAQDCFHRPGEKAYDLIEEEFNWPAPNQVAVKKHKKKQKKEKKKKHKKEKKKKEKQKKHFKEDESSETGSESKSRSRSPAKLFNDRTVQNKRSRSPRKPSNDRTVYSRHSRSPVRSSNDKAGNKSRSRSPFWPSNNRADHKRNFERNADLRDYKRGHEFQSKEGGMKSGSSNKCRSPRENRSSNNSRSTYESRPRHEDKSPHKSKTFK